MIKRKTTWITSWLTDLKYAKCIDRRLRYPFSFFFLPGKITTPIWPVVSSATIQGPNEIRYSFILIFILSTSYKKYKKAKFIT